MVYYAILRNLMKIRKRILGISKEWLVFSCNSWALRSGLVHFFSKDDVLSLEKNMRTYQSLVRTLEPQTNWQIPLGVRAIERAGAYR